MQHRNRMSGFKYYLVRDCKLPKAINSDEECGYVCKIGDRSDFYLSLIKATISDYKLKLAIVTRAPLVFQIFHHLLGGGGG